ncbi:MAG: endoribonuclease MazF [Ferrovibrio sp.]|uniref:endoribonuclease MazF n=1 Tax=Ferrovibrio sp. TaxID=1917215 RepID=UPI002607B909|nr:endoribonuclease MazF [Ferrovibrio sp.]MCW0232953.1 endoribonuclease MazF [Ferrovibrio sp.]
MAEDAYIPERGHLVWLDFNPRVGTEQSGHRPALVLSPSAYNRVGQMICCPLTSQNKNWAFLVPISGGGRTSFAIVDQIRCVDWRTRGAAFIRRVEPAELNRVRTLARGLI